MDWISRFVSQLIDSIVKHGPAEISQWLHSRRQRNRLREMLADRRFPKGFRSTKQLVDGIGADEDTTKRLLVAIGARKSEVSDEWTMNPPPTTKHEVSGETN